MPSPSSPTVLYTRLNTNPKTELGFEFTFGGGPWPGSPDGRYADLKTAISQLRHHPTVERTPQGMKVSVQTHQLSTLWWLQRRVHKLIQEILKVEAKAEVADLPKQPQGPTRTNRMLRRAGMWPHTGPI